MRECVQELYRRFQALQCYIRENKHYYARKNEQYVQQLFFDMRGCDWKKKYELYNLVCGDIDRIIQQQLDNEGVLDREDLVQTFEIVKVCFDVLDECGVAPKLYYGKREEVYLHILEQIDKFEGLVKHTYYNPEYEAYNYIDYDVEEEERIPAILFTEIIKLLIYRDFIKLHKEETYVSLYFETYKNLVWEAYRYPTVHRLAHAMSAFEMITLQQLLEDYYMVKNMNDTQILEEMNTAYAYNLAAKRLYERSYEKKDLDKAITYLQKAMELEKRDAILSMNLAAVRYKMFDIPGAINELITIAEERRTFVMRKKQIDAFITSQELTNMLEYLQALNMSEEQRWWIGGFRSTYAEFGQEKNARKEEVETWYRYSTTQLDKDDLFRKGHEKAELELERGAKWNYDGYYDNDGRIGSEDPLYYIRLEEGE